MKQIIGKSPHISQRSFLCGGKRHTTERKQKTQTMTTGREGKEKRRHTLSGGGGRADHVTEWNKSLTAANTHTHNTI